MLGQTEEYTSTNLTPASAISLEDILEVSRQAKADRRALDAKLLKFPVYIPVQRQHLHQLFPEVTTGGIAPIWPTLNPPVYETGVADWVLVENPAWRSLLGAVKAELRQHVIELLRVEEKTGEKA